MLLIQFIIYHSKVKYLHLSWGITHFYLGFSSYYSEIYLISLTKCTPIHLYWLFFLINVRQHCGSLWAPHLRFGELHSICFFFLILNWYHSIRVELTVCGYDLWG